ncbi:histidine kinase dimerization/phosphoacceptor domain -containing protein [Roseococcus sp.]|uniref:histidine kinase dimerization/phosphoacceptor domain -containing protein n=1 Tax=Roseococcus sp. TaxID=2109646 RepID=UPI003BAD927B
MNAANPWDEQARLAALHRYDVLDAEVDFNDFTKIAAHICDAPIAIVSLVDEKRQWFAAEIGLGVRETPIGMSVCAHAILQPGIFIVPDLTKDNRFDCNPLVTGDPNLRFYGGAVINNPDGLPLGSMCVLDYKPRPQGLTQHQAETLTALSRQITTQLELRLLVREKDLLVKEAHHRVSNSLQMIQSLLSLKASMTNHPEAAEELQNSAARIRSFGAMHEHLYRAGAGVDVDLSAYLQRIIDDQNASSASTLEKRRIQLQADRIVWPSADVSAVGLVMVELTTNALKYGAGVITVRVIRRDGFIDLAVEDEGVSLPPDYDPAQSTGLGMSLILGLLQARNGGLKLDRSKGHTAFVATIALRAA